jgi:hypothetical protein
MSNTLIFHKYFRFFLTPDHLTQSKDAKPKSDYSLHIANSTLYEKIKYSIEQPNTEHTINFTINKKEALNYFNILKYFYDNTPLCFNTNFLYTEDNSLMHQFIEQGTIFDKAIDFCKNIQHDFIVESYQIKKEKKEDLKNKGMVISSKPYDVDDFSSFKFLDFYHYTSICDLDCFIKYEYDNQHNSLNFSLIEPIKNLMNDINVFMKLYDMVLKNHKKPSNFHEKFNIPKNIIFKGVPGTGKSKKIDDLIHKLGITSHYSEHVLRINIHSGTSNHDLMQGIGISTLDSHLQYHEKYGLILEHLFKAIHNPSNPYVLVLEEIQENNLNKIIGDLIYLIEISKRTKVENFYINPNGNVFDTIETIVLQNNNIHYITIPNLVEKGKSKKLIFPNNLYLFCTSNYRDDRKIIEDNLLRRFDIIELYPDENVILTQDNIDESKKIIFSDLFKAINIHIVKKMHEEDMHPDRFMIGHASWLNENNICKPILKFTIDFKDIRNIEFEIFKDILIKSIHDSGYENDSELHEINKYINTSSNYYDFINLLQKCVYKSLFEEDLHGE